MGVRCFKMSWCVVGFTALFIPNEEKLMQNTNYAL